MVNQSKDYSKHVLQGPHFLLSSLPNNAVIFIVIKKLSNSRLDQRPVNPFNCGDTATQPLLCLMVPFTIPCSLSGTLSSRPAVCFAHLLHSQQNQTVDPECESQHQLHHPLPFIYHVAASTRWLSQRVTRANLWVTGREGSLWRTTAWLAAKNCHFSWVCLARTSVRMVITIVISESMSSNSTLLSP